MPVCQTEYVRTLHLWEYGLPDRVVASVVVAALPTVVVIGAVVFSRDVAVLPDVVIGVVVAWEAGAVLSGKVVVGTLVVSLNVVVLSASVVVSVSEDVNSRNHALIHERTDTE